MEVYFLDVGQGTCNVILPGGNQAIIIDTGRRYSELSKLLDSLLVDHLAVVAISHLDADHAQAAPALLTEFRGRIGKIIYPNDHRVMDTPLWGKIQDDLRRGHLEDGQIDRLERQNTPKTMWRSRRYGAELKLFSPTFAENQLAMQKKDSNAASGVLVLKIGDRKIVFPGDSSFEQWQKIHELMGHPLECDIAAIPHHGGMIWPQAWGGQKLSDELRWLYSNALRPQFGVISVGTSNDEGHPREEVISCLRSLGIDVMCTQITDRCCKKVESLRPGLLPLLGHGRSSPVKVQTTSGNCRDLACAGTVIADVTAAAVTVRRFAQHQLKIDQVRASGQATPMCRP